jgi:hypothetical protein
VVADQVINAGAPHSSQPVADTVTQLEETPGAAISLPAPTAATPSCQQGAPDPQLQELQQTEAPLQLPEDHARSQEAVVPYGPDEDLAAMLWWSRFGALGRMLRSVYSTSILAAAGERKPALAFHI